MITLIKNIKQLVNVRKQSKLLHGKELANLPSIEKAFLIIEDNTIADFGPMHQLKGKFEHTIDARDKFVLPAWCDSHTHLMFAGSREDEFISKIKGSSYAEIAANGGGILNSAKKLNETAPHYLFNAAWKRLVELAKMGTGAVEIKSGYGLSVEGELKMLREIKRLKQLSKLTIKATFLGAHAFPTEYINDHKGYIDLIIKEMLPVIHKEKLADYIDVFCENGFFSPKEMTTICNAASSYGLKPKLHVNQLNSIGSINAAVKLNALSADHLEVMTKKDISVLSKSSVIATLLPTSAFFLDLPYPPAREMINAGCAIAIASDYNPGSSPSGNMNLTVAMSCIKMKLLPEEAINAATINGAYAMGLGKELGSITIGKKANLIITKRIPSLAYLPYSFGSNLVDKVILNGEII